jgi:Beta-galactosidase/Glycosyl hydrolase catalytic core
VLITGMRRAWVSTSALVAIAVGGVCAGGAEAQVRYGVVTQAPLEQRDFERMNRGGVDTLRFLLRWSWVEPERGEYEWGATDALVRAAARRGIEALPVVYGSPAWVTRAENRPPLKSSADRRAWSRFVAVLVKRYGPRGDLWRGSASRRPIRRWQIWNEPNFDFYWRPPHSARDYARLVGLAADAIHRRDPAAKVVLGGVAAVHSGVPWWTFLRNLYRVAGARSDFDVVALHPYSSDLQTMRRQVELARSIMREAGDARASLAITEIGWASGGDRRSAMVVGRGGQARRLRQAFDLLTRKSWRISDVDWYAWQDSRAVEAFCSFCEHAGLFDLAGRPKPAWAAYRAAVKR